MARKKYGVMPEKPISEAKIKGDAGLYEVWGIDWLHRSVLINRAGEWGWFRIEKVQLIESSQDEEQPQ